MKLNYEYPGRKYALYPTRLRDALELKLPFPREWTIKELNLPSNWKEAFLSSFKNVLKKYRSVKLYLDICVHCGSCSDKCHYFIATQDPHNI